MTTWCEWIEKRGISDVAKILGVHYETVRAWVHDGNVPADKNKKKLVALSDGVIGFVDFF